MEPKYGGRLSSQWRNFVTQFANTKYTKYTYSHHTFNTNSHTNTRVSSISRFNDMEPKYNGCGLWRGEVDKLQNTITYIYAYRQKKIYIFSGTNTCYVSMDPRFIMLDFITWRGFLWLSLVSP